MHINWERLNIKFKQGERKITLKGDPSLSQGALTPKAMDKILKQKQLMIIELSQIQEVEYPEPPLRNQQWRQP